MPPVRVLIVDDSTTMRALFTTILEEAPGITVIDHAANAEEARRLIARDYPDVVTLDVEMPGTSGLELLREVMAERPLPIIMLSSLTQKGSAATLEALELGAYDCFPKPRAATMEEFRKIGPRLAKLVKAAAAGKAVNAKAASGEVLVGSDYMPGDGVIVLVGNTGGVEIVSAIVNRLPANCPPVIVHLGDAHNVADALVEKLDKSARPAVRAAYDGVPLERGNVYVLREAARHAVVDRWPDAAIRLIDGEPIAGHRPSANLLLQSIAKTAGGRAAVGMLSGIGDDGVAVLAALRGAGAPTLAVLPDEAKARELPEQAAMIGGATPRSLEDLGRALLMHGAAAAMAA